MVRVVTRLMSGMQGGGLNCRLRRGAEAISSTHLTRFKCKLLWPAHVSMSFDYVGSLVIFVIDYVIVCIFTIIFVNHILLVKLYVILFNITLYLFHVK